MGPWRSVNEELPENGEMVLAVKQLKDGRRDICLARCIRNYEYSKTTHIGPYWACSGNNNILFWMPLPKIPEA